MINPAHLTHYTPTVRLPIVVAITAPLWLFGLWPATAIVPIIALAFLALAVVVDVLLLPSSTAAGVTRLAPETIGVGNPGEIVYTLTSTLPRRVSLTLFDALPDGVQSERRRPTVRLAPGTAAHPTTAHVQVPLVGRARGVHPLGTVALRGAGALGLMQRTLVFELRDQITVLPSVAGVRGHHLRALQFRVNTAGTRSIRSRGSSTTFSRLRDYSPGDDPRHIDWKATARRERLTSREFTVEQGQTVIVAVDAGRMMMQMAGELARFEYALSSALMLSDVALAGGDRVGLLLFDDDVRAYVAPGRGAGARRDLRHALTAARGTLVEPDYAAAFRMLATRQRRRALIVLFTDVIDPRSSAALIAHTARAAQRHLLLVVALRNMEVASASLPTATSTVEALYDAVAAEELIRSRADALERMRRRGVSVLDTPPVTMPAAVINRYLELKERSLI